MAKLNDVIKQLREIAKSENLNITDDNLFTNACSFIRGENASKDRANYKKEEFRTNVPMKPATDKQKNKLRQLKIPFNESISLMEASKLIEEKLGKK